MGSLSSLTATNLGSLSLMESLKRAKVPEELIDEVILGNVVSAGLGQAPARQVCLFGKLPSNVPCTTVNKVCASGMKSVAMAADSIKAENGEIKVAGGFESMSNIPHYLPKSRPGLRLGHGHLIDGMINDGLWDLYNDQHMGMCAETCADTHGISREKQDKYALESYRRAAFAWENGLFRDEVFSIEVPAKRNKSLIVKRDEEFESVDKQKFTSLRPAFLSGGSVTAGNASTINDGAATMLVMTMKRARELGVTPQARIISYADAARDPVEFTIAPSDAVKLAAKKANLSETDIDYHEINEAFSVVALANIRLLNLDHEKVNVNGGAVALGHPLGASGARIIGALCSVLRQRDATIGCASICNGGGGASAMILERLS